MAKGILITVETIVQAPVARVWKFWTNPVELQRAGWQAILDNFTKYVEARKTDLQHIP